jgi:hypothetical protein
VAATACTARKTWLGSTAFRRCGDLSLAEIQGLLDNAAAGISEVVALQVAQLDREIQQASALRTHLLTVQSQLQVSEEPGIDAGSWRSKTWFLSSKYLSDDEQLRLNTRREEASLTRRRPSALS